MRIGIIDKSNCFLPNTSAKNKNITLVGRDTIGFNNAKSLNNDKVSFKSAATQPREITHVFKNRAGEITKTFPDRLHEFFGQRNIVFIGSSQTTSPTQGSLTEIQKIAAETLRRGYNNIEGAGSDGVMGAVINGSHYAISKQKEWKDYRGRSLSVVTQGGYGDEDLQRTLPISMARTGKESERIEIFNSLLSNPSSAVVCGPPGNTTMFELTGFIAMSKNRALGTPIKRIFLLGEERFEHLKKMYQQMFRDGNHPMDPYDKTVEQLFEIVEPKDILARFPDMQETFSEEIRKLTKKFLGLPEQASELELGRKYEEFMKNASDEQKINLYLFVKKDPRTRKDRIVEGKDLLQVVNSPDGDLYHYAISSGLYQIQQACRGLKMSWQA